MVLLVIFGDVTCGSSCSVPFDEVAVVQAMTRYTVRGLSTGFYYDIAGGES